MDGSRRSSHGNAYFTGFGAARRIVFFDTLLSRLQPDEIEAVLAHELGHFKLKHVRQAHRVVRRREPGLLALLGWLVGEPWFYAGLGVPVAPPRYGVALVLFMLALPVFTFLARAADVAVFAQARIRGRRLRGANTHRRRRWSPRWSSSTRTTPTR